MNKVNLEERRDRKGFGFPKHANCFVPHAISSSTVIGRQLEAVTAAGCSLFLTKRPSFGASDLFFGRGVAAMHQLAPGEYIISRWKRAVLIRTIFPTRAICVPCSGSIWSCHVSLAPTCVCVYVYVCVCVPLLCHVVPTCTPYVAVM